MCEFAFLGFFGMASYFSIIIYHRDYLDKKYKMFYDEFEGISYQCVIFLLITLSIGLSFGFFGMALIDGGIYSAIAFSISVYFPAIFMLLRINVYRNENSRLLKVVNDEGEETCEEVIGYHPFAYYLLGITLSRGPLGVSLHNILNSIFLNEGVLAYNVVWFVLSICLGCFILSPDIANRILPFELKTRDGLIKFLFISWVLIGVLLLLIII